MIYIVINREVWPENDYFGFSNMPPEEEFLAMKDIFLANISGEYCIKFLNFMYIQTKDFFYETKVENLFDASLFFC